MHKLTPKQFVRKLFIKLNKTSDGYKKHVIRRKIRRVQNQLSLAQSKIEQRILKSLLK